MLEKLTLTTPELAAERERIDAEEKRKEHIRDCLTGLLPWETRDPERDILVEECKEAILALSSDDATFFGPFEMPKLGVKTEDPTNDDDEGAGDDATAINPHKPSEESLKKLAKLEPLPSLLSEFDLDSHVIIRLQVARTHRTLFLAK